MAKHKDGSRECREVSPLVELAARAAKAYAAPDGKSNPKDSLGALKVPLRLVPNVPLIYTALVFEVGAWKYGEANWRNVSVRITVYIEAIKRHNMQLEAGEDLDRDSGLPHTAHIIACACIIEDARACGALIDDRKEKDMSAELLDMLTSSNYTAKTLALTRTPARTLDEVRGGRQDPKEFMARTVDAYRSRVAARPAHNDDARGDDQTGSSKAESPKMARKAS